MADARALDGFPEWFHLFRVQGLVDIIVNEREYVNGQVLELLPLLPSLLVLFLLIVLDTALKADIFIAWRLIANCQSL